MIKDFIDLEGKTKRMELELVKAKAEAKAEAKAKAQAEVKAVQERLDAALVRIAELERER